MSSRSSDREYRRWRAQVIRRDKVCVICGSGDKRTAHHIACWKYHPDSRYDLSNGVCLCQGCHIQLHTNYKKSYRQKCTRDDWDNFLTIAKYYIRANVQ